jgi:integrase
MADDPFSIEEWLKSLSLANKTKTHLKALLHRLFEYAMKWKLLALQRNPIELVEIRGGTKRIQKPRILTVQEFHKLLPLLPEPYRTMVIVAQCLGLRVSEILALKWCDVDFEQLTVTAQRAVVCGRVDAVKTEYSQDVLPLDPDFAAILLCWQRQCPKSPDGWIFPNPRNLKPYHASPIQQDYIRMSGRQLGLGNIGWHTFRHTYRSWLDASGAPMGVQQKLMRHAQDFYHDEYLRRRASRIQARGQQQSGGNAQARSGEGEIRKAAIGSPFVPLTFPRFSSRIAASG